MSIGICLKQLAARLPELEWKMSVLGDFIPAKSLPRGLFRYSFDYKPEQCIAEIKADIKTLSHHDSLRSAQYLSERIHQKICVLVALCNEKSKKPKANKPLVFGVNMISTRQGWLQAIEKEIEHMEEQQKALRNTLNSMKGSSAKPEIALAMHVELGELEKRLTLAQEKLMQSLS